MTFQFRSLFGDSFQSLLTGLGVPGRDKSVSMIPVIDQIAYDLKHLEALYRGNWLAKKIVDIPAFDATRAWRTWNAEKDEVETIGHTERDFGIQRKVQQALVKSRLYGGAALIMGLKNSLLNRELDLNKVGKGDLEWVHVVERWMLQAGPLVRDITSPWFGEPSYYMRSNLPTTPSPGNVDPIETSSLGYSPGETIFIHPSRVVRLVGTEYPDMELAPDSWGDSVLTNVYEAIRDAGLVTQSLANMIADSKVDVFKIPGLTSTLSTTDGTNKMLSYLSNANVAKSIVNALVVDKEIDWERIQTKFEGLDKVLQAYLLIAAAGADIPSTRLLSREPAGMNSTGDSDTRNYYDRVASDQTVRMTPLLNRLDEVLLRHAFGRRDPEWNYNWSPLWQMTDAEKADIALKKAQAYQIDVNAALIPAEALVKGRENQLIEDDFYPGLDIALDDLEKNWEEEVQFLPHAEMEQGQDQFESTQETMKQQFEQGGGPGGGKGGAGNDNDKKKQQAKKDAARRIELMDRFVNGDADVDFIQGEGGRFAGSIGHGGGGTSSRAPHVHHEQTELSKIMHGRKEQSKYAYYARATRIHAYERSNRERIARNEEIAEAYHRDGEKAKQFIGESVSHAVLRRACDNFSKAAVGKHILGLAEDVTLTHAILPILEVGLVAALTELGAPVVAATAGVEVAHYAAQYLVEHSPLAPEHAYALLAHASTALLATWQRFKSSDADVAQHMRDMQDYDRQIVALQRFVDVLNAHSFAEPVMLDDTQGGGRKRRSPFNDEYVEEQHPRGEHGKWTAAEKESLKAGRAYLNIAAETHAPFSEAKTVLEPHHIAALKKAYGENLQALYEKTVVPLVEENAPQLDLPARTKYLTGYHGTTKEVYALAKKEGLKPHGSAGSDEWAKQHDMQASNEFMLGDRKVSVYLAADPHDAASFAKIAADVRHQHPTLLEIHIPRAEANKYAVPDMGGGHNDEGANFLRYKGVIKPEWIVRELPFERYDEGGSMQIVNAETHKIVASHADAQGPLVVYAVVFPALVHDAEYVEEQHPRGEHGKWTQGSGTAAEEFVSPNTTQLSFPEAMRAIGSQHHKLFKEAAEQVDAATNSYAVERSVIGAWSDGAEDSTMMVTPKIDPDSLMLNAAIKGALGRQKSVLVFSDSEKGPHQLYHIQLPGQTLTDAHNALLKEGIEFHTLLPREQGAEAIVVDMDGSMRPKLDKLADKFGSSGVVYNGTATFIGTTKEDGTDEEQRADAVKHYEDIIAHSPSDKRGIWSGLHHRWAARLKATEYTKRQLVHA